MKTFTRIPVSKNFYLDEFVPPTLYEAAVPTKGIAYFDQHILTWVQYLRDEIGKPIFINNWYQLVTFIIKKKNLSGWPELKDVESFCKEHGYSSKLYDERCVRDPQTSTGAPASRHKFEMKRGIISRKTDAVDIQIDTMTGPDMFKLITENHTYMNVFYSLGFRRIEDPSITPGWLHSDKREHSKSKGIQVIDRVKETQFIAFK